MRDLWGLRNTSTTAWEVQLPGREPTSVQPGQTVALVPDTVLLIGQVEARFTT